WLWKFIDGAKTPGELYGRALVAIAAEQHAVRIAVPASQRSYRLHWSSHKDIARKALKKLAAGHLPASLSKLERAIKQADAAYDKAIAAQRKKTSKRHVAKEPTVDEAINDEDLVGEDLPEGGPWR
ncbi:MAG: hypothetical protein M3065_07480, partial [Actinomycetota bacterium]|nr:hypothetical protein [Actinomycetota bacterium]